MVKLRTLDSLEKVMVSKSIIAFPIIPSNVKDDKLIQVQAVFFDVKEGMLIPSKKGK